MQTQMIAAQKTELLALQKDLEELNFLTTLIDVSEIFPLPILSIGAISKADEPYTTNIAFVNTPPEELEVIRFIQLSTDVPIQVTEANCVDIYGLLEFINHFMVLTHVVLWENQLYCKYTHSLTNNESLLDPAFIQTLSMHMIFSGLYVDTFTNLANGSISLEDAKTNLLSLVNKN